MVPPGSVKLIGQNNFVISYPKPTDDYDDPLNWSFRRKAIHYFVILIYTGVTFAFVDISPIPDTTLHDDLSMVVQEISVATALRYIGMGLTGVGLIPFAYRYGRRPLYLFSVTLQLLTCVWLAILQSKWEYYAACGLLGAGAAVSQALVPITITDVFFINQFATMYGLFMLAQGTGAFLGPMLADVLMHQVHAQDRSLAWYMTAMFGITALLLLVAAEESTFVPNVDNQIVAKLQEESIAQSLVFCASITIHNNDTRDLVNLNRASAKGVYSDLPPEPRTWRKRHSLITNTGRPIKKRFLSCFVILVNFPGVAYAALTYGFTMAWLFILVQNVSTELSKPPYNFNNHSIKMFNLGPLIGHIIGTVIVPPMSDSWIVRRARGNDGIYEPEMRLWFALGAGVFVIAGVSLFGIGISEKAPLPILTMGFGLFSFGFGICLETCLTYITDCYHNMIGDALVGVVFVRNVFAATAWFTVAPWVDKVGVRSVFIVTIATTIPVLLIPVPLLLCGRRGRAATAAKYRYYSLAAIPPATLERLRID